MLDPRLPELLPGSNLAAFQQRWRTYGEPAVGDDDALFFGFARPALRRHDLATLDADDRRCSAPMLSVWRAGEHWHALEGRLVR